MNPSSPSINTNSQADAAAGSAAQQTNITTTNPSSSITAPLNLSLPVTSTTIITTSTTTTITSTISTTITTTTATTTTPSRRHRRHRRREDYPLKRRNTKRKYARHADANGIITCRICYDEKPATAFVRRLRKRPELPAACGRHLDLQCAAGTVCRVCIGGALEAQVGFRGPEQSGCLECHAAWEPRFVTAFLTAEQMGRFTEAAMGAWKARMRSGGEEEEGKAVVFVDCPKEGCGNGVLVAPRKMDGCSETGCEACGQAFCTLCKRTAHPGGSCEGGAGAEHDRLLETLAAMGARRCPNCAAPIVKDGGCSKMTCQGCKHVFAWDQADPITIL